MGQYERSELKAAVLELYIVLIGNRITAPAAFGLCCTILRLELDCDLVTAVALLDSWLKEVP